MPEKRLITAALPYANGPLHFGHIAGAYLPADCYARFERMIGHDVLFVSGSDEYGIAITLSAELAGRTPQEQVDHFHVINRTLFEKLAMSFDHYSRTTCAAHPAPVKQFFLELLANGFIEEKITDQLYSEADQKFLADRYVVGTCPKCGFANARGDECPSCGASYDATDLKNPRSKLTNALLIHRATKHWFLMLDKLQPQLLDWLGPKNWKPTVINFLKGYMEELHPRAITRDMTWGIPVPLPDADGKVLYVWFDAPIGYISSAIEWAAQIGQPERWKEYWMDPKTRLVHFIGKDNIPFHGAIFPAMVMGQNLPYKLVDELPANEFLKLEGRQFSKSDNWTIDLEDFLTRYSADQIRYTLAANAPETADAEFTWKDFQARCNGELSGKLGNLVNRVLTFAKSHANGQVPPRKLEPVDETFLAEVADLAEQAYEAYSTFRLRKASQTLMELAAAGNVYFDKKKPWSAAKNPSQREAMLTTIACCLECIRTLAIVGAPIIPDTCVKIGRFLGHETPLTKWELAPLSVGQTLGEPSLLFLKIEDTQIAQEVAKLGAKPMEVTVGNLAYDDFAKVELRVGVILEAEAVPKSNKLLKLKVDMGTERRQIVSGIKGAYTPESVIGRHVVVVTNLKPATLMGLESQGMILAGGVGAHLRVVQVEDLPPGTVIS